MSDQPRDAILDAAIKKHDLLYGTDHCDRKYLMSCNRLPEIILSLPTPDPEEYRSVNLLDPFTPPPGVRS